MGKFFLTMTQNLKTIIFEKIYKFNYKNVWENISKIKIQSEKS